MSEQNQRLLSLVLGNQDKRLVRAFWAGALFQGFLGMAFQSWVSESGLESMARSGQGSIHWGLLVALGLIPYIYYRWLRRG